MSDMAAKAGILSAITRNKMPADSFFPYITKLCMEEWQDTWNSTSNR